MGRSASGVSLRALVSVAREHAHHRRSAGRRGAVRAVGWPRCTYRLDRIHRAEVVDLPVWSVAFGFWWTPRRTCGTVRSGPTLRLTLTSGRTVTITVPDPHAAAAALHEAGTA